MRAPKLPTFATEAEMCAAFLAELPEGWTAYAETAGWDILLSRDEDGFQIGVQAKMRLNADVLVQAIESRNFRWTADAEGPDCRAVMVPSHASQGLGPVATYIGLTVITVEKAEGRRYVKTPWYQPILPSFTKRYPSDRAEDRWHEWCPSKRHALPDYVPDVVAGASAPLQLTRWKIAAIKVAVLLERRGFVCRTDFKALGIDYRRWATPDGWLRSNGDGTWIANRMPSFRSQHPRVYDEIAADADTWMANLPAPAPRQGRLA